MSKRTEQIRELLAPVVNDMGYELWGIEYLQGRGAVLRLYIDHEAGITVDDCVAVSHEVSGVLDVEDPIPGEYNLEVSSPGMDRPLFELSQFERYLGEQVQLKLLAPVAGKRKMMATLVAVDGDTLVVMLNGDTLRIPYSQVDRARLEPRFD
ncbi:ribosome maturation factor RimP [Alloalcanivorax xenomutans]|jgi:ribosome maturation factor RimP|uniref:Ribosome maturation factor RimP n=1 Tax=Alloalcanivorax xenomutans TaxID=1094342 RepID=A0A9Q3W830_9GAMM|nr:ribosome maturation factor RimP [Alloalcanivorax xenomutans]ERS15466.1 ribosome maturation protein RimP [Alcanivorax sp. PN-3]KYZ86898.1 ribosome maturation factor RimP [Alcanivorax sp. KX64203]MBA4721242.1 ribosome maturation factor RimP [Alcanivorax sp.]ARB47177.1 ribosome maturation protein RimP [Alloalcanivorax xenomutans]MCE7510956.1 ribosome maturation factor RimP [Alloalcanivorax xenomutans]|tara:strand:- start:281 stop:736 length:456 start_codon:yes stop_codon:yes gene_type:complete|eukprot:gnl/TRDRNA2_/TRDRNA2_177626_c2_seq2.p2 gnl/TRDRNA2_/TRDRNA2_177626_c2~~gnl/TRDRNA2_/TRDRNA2_177626_c2_seq2.p2  ORF type:complete len:152 (-),score=19.50 gnl/TRDRNA2_/TRDRNA2_177626_c2_seq2:341-796(-)